MIPSFAGITFSHGRTETLGAVEIAVVASIVTHISVLAIGTSCQAQILCVFLVIYHSTHILAFRAVRSIGDALRAGIVAGKTDVASSRLEIAVRTGLETD